MSRSAFVCALLLGGACATPAPEPREVPDGRELFRTLFGGRDLAGWEGDARFWRVEAGAIVGESSAANPLTETTYLVWRGGEVADFELELEWRFATPSGANSGLQFRSRAGSATDIVGYQADLETGPDWTGGLYEQGGRGVVTRRGERVVLAADGSKAVERFADGAELLARVEPGAWNHLCVTAFGPRLTLAVNGELFSETIDLDPAHAARRGSIALQLHAGAPMRVEFRGLRLRELAPAPPEKERAPAARAASEWIWPTSSVTDHQVAWFRRRFELASEPARAELWISADNHFDAWLGGEGVATSDDWPHPLRVDVRPWLKRGENELLVRAENDQEEAGLVLALEFEFADGSRTTVVSDAAFESCLEPTEGLPEARRGEWLAREAEWKAPVSFGALGVGPWRTLAEDVSASGVAPEAETITVPPGFRVERLYSVPLATQGSWVALTVDPRGRFYASDQYGGLYRIEVPPLGTREETRVERLPLALGEAHGLLWAFDSLYAVVSAAGEFASGLYRARDTDGDGELDRVECLRAFDGDGEHGPHGIVADADGHSLVLVGGNYTKLPGPFERSRLPPHWGEDVLLEPFPDPNGHAVGIRAPGGWVARTDRDGEEWELVAAGLRNAYDLAFDAHGELFTFDSDMEWDVGLPWYVPTRILHVVSGADFGWRTGSSRWPADNFDSLPAAVDIGLASPTGLVFGSATRFPAPWNDALFACDWAYGRILAVHLEPDGASFRGRHEVFASGQPFPVTDVAVGPDGALYATIGGRRVQSGLYRISWMGADGASPDVATDREGERAAEFARANRHSLEKGHAGWKADRPDQELIASAQLVDELAGADRFLRYAARISLEHLDPARWPGFVRRADDPRVALEGWLALVHCDPSIEAHEVVERALGIFAVSVEHDERLDALRLVELALLRLHAGDGVRVRIREALDAAYPSGDARLDRALLGLLVTVGADVAERALGELERAATQEERIAILYALRAHRGPWSERNEARLVAALERELATLQGGASARGYVEDIRTEALARLGANATRGAASTSDPLPAAAPRIAPHPAHAWTLAELEPSSGELAGRELARGRAAYESASCARCHRFAGTGENQGPDLTGAAGRYSARDLLLAILEPSREVPDVWRDVELWGADGLLGVGRVEVEGERELLLRATSGESVHLDPAAILERRPHRLSRMPEGLLDTLTRDEVLDLVAYVLSGREPTR